MLSITSAATLRCFSYASLIDNFSVVILVQVAGSFMIRCSDKGVHSLSSLCVVALAVDIIIVTIAMLGWIH